MRRNFPSALLKNMLLLFSLKASLSLSLNPLNLSQRPLRHQNRSQTILKLADLLLSKKLNHSVLTDRS